MSPSNLTHPLTILAYTHLSIMQPACTPLRPHSPLTQLAFTLPFRPLLTLTQPCLGFRDTLPFRDTPQPFRDTPSHPDVCWLLCQLVCCIVLCCYVDALVLFGLISGTCSHPWSLGCFVGFMFARVLQCAQCHFKPLGVSERLTTACTRCRYCRRAGALRAEQ